MDFSYCWPAFGLCLPVPCGLLLKLLHLQPQLHPPPGQGSRPIWCMSRGGLSAEDIRGLTEAIQKLTLAVETLTERFEDSVPGGWELVEEESRPPGFEEPNLSKLHCLHNADTGPPKIPSWVLNIADKELKGGTRDSLFRAERAFTAGFWAKISLDTHTNYGTIEPIPLQDRYWIVLRAPRLQEPIVVTAKKDVERLVGISAAAVFEGFASKAEILCFCAGAGISVPGLKRWKGSN